MDNITTNHERGIIMRGNDYHHKDILRIFSDINPRTLISWVEKGLLMPKEEPENRGGKRVYSYKNLLEIAFIRELASYMLPLRYVRLFLNMKDVQDSFKKGDYDRVFFFSKMIIRKIRTADHKAIKLYNWPRDVGCIPVKKFNLRNLKGNSGIWVNLKELKDFVDSSMG